jgi:tripartite-type tricarboxylate transporter receptor subunit TctC
VTSRFLLFVLALAFAAPSVSQQFPSRPGKIVVPTSPGGATDSFSRAIAQRLAEGWGQPVVVENRPGANQIIGADYVAKETADG